VSIKTSEGFRIAAVGGSHALAHEDASNSFGAVYTDADVEALAKTESATTDLLITSDWPAAIRDGAKAAYIQGLPEEVQSLADLSTALRPRYHFSTSAGFYEREPFFHASADPPHPITRFVSLAPFGNAEKSKWIYAFSLEPSTAPPSVLPQGCTASPFLARKKRKLEPQAESFNNYRYANGSHNNNNDYQNHRGNKRRRNQPPPTPDTCFFCLSNPNCETHMIGSIGEESYLALAKGPLTTATTFPDLGGLPGHTLLVPLQHAATLGSIAEKATREATVTEMQRYVTALQSMLAAKSKDENSHGRLGSVTWQLSRSGGVHAHWQFLPLPVDLITRGLVEAAFDVEAENQSLPSFAKSASELADLEAESEFFKVSIWSEGLRKEMVMPLKGFDGRFNAQFGRVVVGKLLELQGRTDWRNCVQTTAEETSDAETFKKSFEEFDPSLGP